MAKSVKPTARTRSAGPSQLSEQLNRALAFHRAGRLAEADTLYQAILHRQPEHAVALYLRGTAMFQIGNAAAARQLLQRAVLAAPDHAPSHINLALVLVEAHRGEEALAHADRALELAPDSLDAQLNRAAVLLKVDKPEAALQQLMSIVPLPVERCEFWLNRGLAEMQLGLYSEADASFARALTLAPGHLGSLNRRAANQLRAGNAAGALQLALAAIQQHPAAIPLRITLARVYSALGQSENATAALDDAARIGTTSPAVWVDLAVAWLELGNATAALDAADHALRIDPENRDGFLVAGNAFSRQHDRRSALLNYERAMAIDPRLELFQSGSEALFELGRYEAVVNVLSPLGDDLTPFQLGILQTARMYLCDWKDFDASRQRITDHAWQTPAAFYPFNVLALVDAPSLHLHIARAYAAVLPHEHKLGAETSPANGVRMRIGYYSADFHDHATMLLMAQLFESHDCNRFEVHGFSLARSVPSALMDRVRPHLDQLHECAEWSDAQIVEHSRALGIDIAIDLKGYTQDARPALFSLRCAPVQVSYLGYPGSTGMQSMDYVIADPVVLPPEHESDFSERVVYMPFSYQCNDQHRTIAPRIFSRAELGLPDQGFVFCCFNNNYKILPAVFATWMRILSLVPGSVLWLFEGNEFAARNLRRSAAEFGVDTQRLVFAPRMPPAEHLARVQLADLFLDTAPYGAHTTASDALWAGVPVVTCPGQSFASRVAASLLTAVGLPELIAASPTEYEALAVALAAEPGRLTALREHLRNARTTSPLFDGALFARHLEQAFEAMHKRRLAGLPPDVIHISA